FSLQKALGIFNHRTTALIALFLFLQMSLEAIINNWTTTYLEVHRGLAQDRALFGLSLFIGGMTVMRILIGSIFRSFSAQRLLFLSMTLILVGSTVLLMD